MNRKERFLGAYTLLKDVEICYWNLQMLRHPALKRKGVQAFALDGLATYVATAGALAYICYGEFLCHSGTSCVTNPTKRKNYTLVIRLVVG